jgi:Neuraminidase (sialidase)
MTRRELIGGALVAGTATAARWDPATVITRQPRYYHAWPTLARRKNGELIVTYSGSREAHVCPFGRVEMIRSFDEGKTWSWPQVLMDTAIDDRDSGVVETPRGTLLVTTFTSLAFEKVLAEAKGWDAERMERWQAVVRATTPQQKKGLVGAWMLRSTDGGLTWSSPYKVPVMAPHGPVVTPSGRLLYAGVEYPDDKGRRVGLWESKDDGLTWQWVAPIPGRPSDDTNNFHELHLVEAADGRLIAHVRNHNKENDRETLQSESNDGGRTWSVVHPIGVWGLPSHLLRLRDGRLLMTYSYRRDPRGNQARVSADNGRTWSAPIVLSDDGTGDLGYPSTVELPGGDLLSVWYEYQQSSGALSVLKQLRWRL